MSDLDLVEPVTTAARAAGEFVAGLPRSAPARTMGEFRAAFDAVDKPASALLRDHLAGLRPDARWSEELDVEVGERGELWVVDVVDGAVQYLQGLPQWCVTITLVRDRRPVLTVLHNPVLGETYGAVDGEGAYRDGVRITPSAKEDLSIALVATSQPPFIGAHPEAVERAGRSLSAVLPAVGAIRNLGPTSWQMADVAAGRIDAFWQFGRDDSNVLAGALIGREAGATVTDAAGAPWVAGAGSVLVAAPPLHRQLLTLLDS